MKKLLVFLGVLPAFAALTSITGPLYTPSGDLFGGTITVSLNSPATAQPLYNSDGRTLTGFSYRVTVTGGALTLSLEANDAITPSGTSYTARFQPDSATGGGPWSETWIVPTSGVAVKVHVLRSTTTPIPDTLWSPSQLSSGGASAGQYLRYSGTSWQPYTFSALTDPTTTTGDIIYRASGGSLTRLGVGTSSQVLTVSGGLPAWVDSSGAVASVFARTGAVTAQSGDYTAAQVTNAVSTLGSYADPAWITSLAGSKVSGAISGNAGTSTALAANGANCSAGNYPLGVDASGNAESCTTAPAGTVTSVSVTTANGVSGTVATATSTPAITLALGAITPSSVAASGNVTGANLSGTNTGDQTTISGNAGTATALAANGANCSAGSFPLGVNASGAAETCTALPTTIAGTANQITASAATGAITLSIPTNPTLPGTTTGTFSGDLTGNVTGNVSGSSGSTTGNAATSTALAANGANCSAGAYPKGVDASGASESCTAVSLTADVSGILPVANGGTNNAFFAVSGPATSAKTYTFPNASATVLTSNSAVTISQGGTGTGSTLTGLVRGSAAAMTAAELSGDATTSGSNAVTVARINGTALSGLATGILKNTTTTGVPSIAVAGTDYVVPGGNVATATALAANGANCSAGSFPLGVNASGASETCTALPTTISGTASQITASASTGAVTLSLPSTINVNTSGNAATSTALAANGTNCSPGNYPLGVDAAGNAESCTAAGGGSGDVLGGSALTTTGAVPYVASSGTLDEDGSFLRSGTGKYTLYDPTAITGDSQFTVRRGAGGGGPSISEKNNAGSLLAQIDNGYFVGSGISSFAGDYGLYSAATTPVAGNSLILRSGYGVAMSSTSSIYGTIDAGFVRSSAGLIEINNGTAGTFRDLKLRNLEATGTITGNASTATALAANGTNCGAGNYPLGVDASGNAEGCTAAAGGGTVTTVSVTTANGVSGSVADPTTTPAITLTLGAITPTSVAASGNVTGANLSGTNTGDQTTISGNAGTASALAANPADCSAGQYANTIAANGDLACAQVAYSQVSGTPTLATVATSGSASDLGSGTLAAARGGAGTVNGILKANGAGVVSAATVGTDYGTPDATTKTLTNTTYDAAATGNVLTFLERKYLTAAGCANATATAAFDTPTSNAATAICIGTTTTTAFLVYADGSTQVSTVHHELPDDWVSTGFAVSLKYTGSVSSTSTIDWRVSTACVADGEDPTTPSYNATSTNSAAGPTTTPQLKSTSFTPAVTNCAAGEMMYLKIEKVTGDTYAGSGYLMGVELTYSRTQ